MLAVRFSGSAADRHRRPYLYTAIAFAVVGLPFVAAKLALLERQRVWPPEAALLLAASAAFSVVHVLTARGMVLWARRRYEMGLLGFGCAALLFLFITVIWMSRDVPALPRRIVPKGRVRPPGSCCV